VTAHPAGEGVMVGQQRWVVAAPGEAGGLCLRAEVEQAHRDPVQFHSRRRRKHLAGCHGIAAEQQMPALGLELHGALHGSLRRLLAPGDGREWWDAADVVKLHALDLR
jgi:hypothetical protein